LVKRARLLERLALQSAQSFCEGAAPVSWAPQSVHQTGLDFLLGATARLLLWDAAQERPQNLRLRTSDNFSSGSAMMAVPHCWHLFGAML